MEWEERGRNKRSKVEKVGRRHAGKIAGTRVKGREGWAQEKMQEKWMGSWQKLWM